MAKIGYGASDKEIAHSVICAACKLDGVALPANAFAVVLETVRATRAVAASDWDNIQATMRVFGWVS